VCHLTKQNMGLPLPEETAAAAADTTTAAAAPAESKDASEGTF
jgi:hypothetical protein